MAKNNWFLTLIIALLLLFPFAGRALAYTIRTDEKIVIGPSESIVGNLYAFGESVTIEGKVDGDIICAGKNVAVFSDVTGDIICAGQTISISGTVGGSIRLIAQNSNIESQVERNILMASQNATLEPESLVMGEAAIAGQNLRLKGYIDSDILMAGQNISVEGEIGGNVLTAVENLNISSGAGISGDLEYASQNDADISNQSMIGGKVTKKTLPEFERSGKDRAQFMQFNKNKHNPWQSLSRLLIYLGAGMLILLLFPKFSGRSLNFLIDNPLKVAGIGFLSVLMIPALIIFCIMTIIGIPLAILLIFAYLLIIFIARLWSSYALSVIVFRNLNIIINPVAVMTIGIVLTFFIFQIPVLGPVLTILVEFWGIGGVLMAIFTREKQTEQILDNQIKKSLPKLKNNASEKK